MPSQGQVLLDAMPLNGDARVATLKQFDEFVNFISQSATRKSSNALAPVISEPIRTDVVAKFMTHGYAWFCGVKYIHREPVPDVSARKGT